MTAVDFLGEQFEVPEQFDSFAWWEYCEFAADGESAGTPEGMGALSRLVKACVRPEDMPRWRRLRIKQQATPEDIMKFVASVMATPSERPTVRPSDSPDGPLSTLPSSESSAAESASPEPSGPLDRALERYEGRPDIQAGFLRQEQRLRSVS